VAWVTVAAAAAAQSSSSSSSSSSSNGDAAGAHAATAAQPSNPYGWSFDTNMTATPNPKVQDIPVASIRRPLGRTRSNGAPRWLRVAAVRCCPGAERSCERAGACAAQRVTRPRACARVCACVECCAALVGAVATTCRPSQG
jgi:hypothetical protein